MMIKRFLLSLCILTCCICNGMEKRSSIVVDCIQASKYAYTSNLPMFSKDTDAPVIFNGYYCIHAKNIANSGFTGVTFYNPETEIVITAFRGTDPSIKANIMEDSGICAQLAAQSHQTMSTLLEHQYSTAADYYFKKNPLLGRAQSTVVTLLASMVVSPILKYETSNNPAIPDEELDKIIDEACKYYRTSHATRGGFALGLGSSSDFQSFVTGHSLGGFLAQLVCARNRALTGITFNAPGASSFLREEPTGKYYEINNYVREHDVVGTLGNSLGQTIPLKDIPTDGFGSWTNPFKGITDFCESNHSIELLVNDFTKEDDLNNLLLHGAQNDDDNLT